MAIQNFEELNILKRRSEPFRDYFKGMGISQKQKEDRIELALSLEEILMIFFDLFQTGIVDEVRIKQEITYSLYEVLTEDTDNPGGKYFDTEEALDKYVKQIVNDTYDATVENMEKSPNDYDYTGETPYWVSDDRAMFIAENEANALFNCKELIDAKEAGYTHKVWNVYPDNRVRQTHMDVFGATLPLDVYFEVGEARMLYPKDNVTEFSTGAEHPEETVNCRCWLTYF
jgi:hypothetical protein